MIAFFRPFLYNGNRNRIISPISGTNRSPGILPHRLSAPSLKEEITSQDCTITYHSKDITSKILGDQLLEKSFAVYGLNVPRIVQVLPTNLPVIEANELRIDHLFQLSDGSIALVDYESKYADTNKLKYLSYIIRILKKELAPGGQPSENAPKFFGRSSKNQPLYPHIRMLVLYTADVSPGQTSPRMDTGCLQFELEEAFLLALDSDAIEAELLNTIQNKEALTPEAQMKFIILPLTHKGTAAKQECIRRCFSMARQIEEDSLQAFLLSGLVTFSDKIITEEDSIQIKEWIKMTKVGRLFEQERLESVKATAREIAIRMLQRGDSVESVASIVTLLSKEEVEALFEATVSARQTATLA